MKKRMLLGALMIGASLLVTACGSTEPADGSKEPPAASTQVEVTVYRGNQDGTAVIKEKESITKPENAEKKVQALFELLKKSGKDTAPAVPQNVKLNSAALAGDVLTLDLSEHVQSMSSTEEKIFLDALPPTVFENVADVKTIKFKINGQDAEALSQTDVSQGIARP